MAVFTPRLHYYGIPTSDYYNAWNAYQYPNDMPNCVAYTYGRFNELAQVTSNPWSWPTGNGNDWYSQAGVLGLQRGSTPQVGACICWDGGLSGLGHTAIVETLERIIPGGPVTSFRISNSLYDANDRTPKDQKPYFFMGRVYMNDLSVIYYDDGTWSGNVYTFQGFIYHPNYPPGTPVQTIGKPELISVITAIKKKAINFRGRR